jgi:hypothetical protein
MSGGHPRSVSLSREAKEILIDPIKTSAGRES